jgi:hypothetical protein
VLPRHAMDLAVITKLEEAGIDKTFRTCVPTIDIELDERGVVQLAGSEVTVVAADDSVRVALRKISELYAGTRTPPSFRQGPTDEYVQFFATIERSVIEYCRRAGRAEYDGELERLYTHLRRRPDGNDPNPLFSYMQAATRLYMSVVDVSQAELDAVCRRLSQSAGRFGQGPTSTNYCEVVASSLATL